MTPIPHSVTPPPLLASSVLRPQPSTDLAVCVPSPQFYAHALPAARLKVSPRADGRSFDPWLSANYAPAMRINNGSNPAHARAQPARLKEDALKPARRPSSLMDTTGVERRRRFEVLATESAIANTHLHFFRGLWNARSAYSRELSEAKDFWDYTFSAHIEMALLQLCRIYDTHEDGINLLTLLLQTKKIVRRQLQNSALQKFDEDLQTVQRKSPDPLVAKLRYWRNNIIAHYNCRIALTGRNDVWKENPWDNLDEIQMLIDRSFEMLDRYGCTHGQQTIQKKLAEGQDGFQNVLHALRWATPRGATT